MPVAVAVSVTAHNWAFLVVASSSQAAWHVVAPLALPDRGPPTVMSVTHMLVCACTGNIILFTTGFTQIGDVPTTTAFPKTARLALISSVVLSDCELNLEFLFDIITLLIKLRLCIVVHGRYSSNSNNCNIGVMLNLRASTKSGTPFESRS